MASSGVPPVRAMRMPRAWSMTLRDSRAWLSCVTSVTVRSWISALAKVAEAWRAKRSPRRSLSALNGFGFLAVDVQGADRRATHDQRHRQRTVDAEAERLDRELREPAIGGEAIDKDHLAGARCLQIRPLAVDVLRAVELQRRPIGRRGGGHPAIREQRHATVGAARHGRAGQIDDALRMLCVVSSPNSNVDSSKSES